MSKRDIFILNEVLATIRKAKSLYSDVRKEKSIEPFIRIAIDADNHIDKVLEGIKAILPDLKED